MKKEKFEMQALMTVGIGLIAGLVLSPFSTSAQETPAATIEQAKAPAQEAPAAAIDPAKAAAAARERATAEEARKAAATMRSKLPGNSGEMLTTMEALAAAHETRAGIFDNIAVAVETGDGATRERLADVDLPKADRLIGKLTQKVNLLENGARCAKPLPESWRQETQEGALRELEAYEGAYKALAEAYDNYAMAITPDAKDTTLEDMHDVMLARADDLEVCKSEWALARDVVSSQTMRDRYQNPDMSRLNDELLAARQELVNARRQRNTIDVQIRRQERLVARAKSDMRQLAQKVDEEAAVRKAAGQ